jgi:predicted cupin superfamily sugar epimerase
MDPRAAGWIERLGLAPHPEGGWFAETWRSPLRVRTPAGERSAGTAIHYLITPDSFSALHRVASDEVFHFYLGDPVELLQIDGAGRVERSVLGTDLGAGMWPQAVVPAGAWQGSRLVEGGAFALLGATVAPGFEYADFELGRRADLLARFPHLAREIERLTVVR